MGNSEWKPTKKAEQKKMEETVADIEDVTIDDSDRESVISDVSSVGEMDFRHPPIKQEDMDLMILQEYVRDSMLKQYEVDVKVARTIKNHFSRNVRVYRCEIDAIVDEANPHDAERFVFERKTEEFNTLCEVLRESLPGVFAPPPSKLVRGKFWNHPKEERSRHAIQACLEHLLSHPFIRHDKIFADFLTSKEEFTHTRAEIIKTEHSKGRVEWLEMLKSVAPIKTPGVTRTGLQSELNDVLANLEAVKRDVHSLIEHQETHNKAMEAVSHSVHAWKSLESNGLSMLKPHKEFSKSIATSISNVESAYNKEEEVNKSKTQHLKDVLHQDLNLEIDSTKRMLKEVMRVKKPLKKLQRLRRRVEELKEQETQRIGKIRESGKSVDDPDKTLAGIREKLLEAEKEEVTENEEVSRLYKGLFGVELFIFRVHRAKANVTIMRKLAEANQDLALNASKSWDLAVKTMPGVPETPAIVYLLKDPLLAKPPPVISPTEKKDEIKTYRAIKRFESRAEDERDVDEGETITGKIMKNKPGFVYVENEGYVPTFVLTEVDRSSRLTEPEIICT